MGAGVATEVAHQAASSSAMAHRGGATEAAHEGTGVGTLEQSGEGGGVGTRGLLRLVCPECYASYTDDGKDNDYSLA